MKLLSTITILCLAIQLQAQNWIGNRNFIEMFDQSDVVVIGTIDKIENYKQDTISLISFNMPLKSLTLSPSKAIKGTYNNNLIHYKDIFNGCVYAPVLYENIINTQTLIFGKIRNDSIFQIGSMNESPTEIAKAIIDLNNIDSTNFSQGFTNWFFETAQNKDLFELLNHNISHKKEPLFSLVDSLNFTIDQRNHLYDIINSYENLTYYNDEMIKILLKYNDSRLQEILKTFLIKLKNSPDYSNVDELMTCISQMNKSNEELRSILKKFKSDYRTEKRKKMLEEFINKIKRYTTNNSQSTKSNFIH